MIENIKVAYNSKGIVGGSMSPTDGNSFMSMGGIDYLIGSLLILIGILIYVVFQKKAKRNYEKYKQDQLDLYNKNRGTKVTDYTKTNLYVPFWEKAKFSTPILSTILFVSMGIIWIVWTAFGTPDTIL